MLDKLGSQRWLYIPVDGWLMVPVGNDKMARVNYRLKNRMTPSICTGRSWEEVSVRLTQFVCLEV